ncbi:(Fe-S)-binding protein [Candidatus Bathyarchaeota archaeon]|nr:(Fe-S)-binding protein [Candidatus Bathyarchaeota archaeon]
MHLRERTTKRRRKGRSLENYKKDVYLCARCGYCRNMVRARDDTDLICPIRENTGGFDSFTARGRNIIARVILEGKIDAQNVSEEFVDSLYACTLCGNCQMHCLALDPETWDSFPHNKFVDRKIDILGITESLRSLIVEKGVPPPAIRDVLNNIHLYGNPEGRPRSKRDAFTKGLNFHVKRARDERCGTLFYVGSIASYNERNQRTAQAFAKILRAANIDFCIFGNEEEDSGGDVLRLGEGGLFGELARRNFELFRKYEIKNVICLSPHDYDAFLNDYPAFLGEEWSRLDLEVQHYTEFIMDLIHDKSVNINHKFDKNVTFHDPCYLGRINDIYDAPREILRAAGANLVEMRLSHQNSYCCGGGGGGIWYEPLHKPRLENERAKQACDTHVNVLAVACPICTQILEDGMSAIEKCNMKVLDVAEILLEPIGSKDQNR